MIVNIVNILNIVNALLNIKNNYDFNKMHFIFRKLICAYGLIKR